VCWASIAVPEYELHEPMPIMIGHMNGRSLNGDALRTLPPASRTILRFGVALTLYSRQ
jgi:hypothetical protein